MLPKITQWFRLQNRTPFKIRNWDWKRAVQLERWANALDRLATIALKLGTLFLIIIALVLVNRIFQDQGYIIEAFSVPKHLEESGYKGEVIAHKVQDEVLSLKELASSVKEDSLQLAGNQQPDLNVAVMGIGVSLRSITYHLRDMFGRSNHLIQGEVTKLDEEYALTLRMTGYATQTATVKVGGRGEKAAIDSLLQRGAELIITNTDPYRLAVVKYRQKKFDEAKDLVRIILRARPQEAHWAYLAWGSILEKQGKFELALDKFEKAARSKPDFPLAYARQSWALNRLNRNEEGLEAMRKSVSLDPENIDRWRNLAWTLHSAGQYEKADSAFEQMTILTPEVPEVWSTWADSKMNRGDLDEALEIVEQAENMVGENAEGYMIRALASLVRADTVQALQHATAAFDMDPSKPWVSTAVMRGHYAIGNYEEVVHTFQRAEPYLTGSGNHQSALNFTAMAHNRKGEHALAMDKVRAAIALNPLEGAPYTTLAETFAYTGAVDSFYFYMKVAFEKGFELHNIDEAEPPYAALAQTEQYQEFMKPHRLKN